MSLAMYRHALGYTVKPLQGPGLQTAAEVEFLIRMAEVVGPAQEVLSLGISPVSPLTFPEDAVGAILEVARAGVVLTPLPCPTAGTTAPLSIAGALAQQNAEVLATIVLAQVARPGLPIVYCGRLAMMEPRSGISVWGGVELGLASAGTVAIGHRYGLPVNVYGFSTNSHVPDLQNGFERSLNATIPALAGADELSGIGEMEAGVMGSHAQMVIDSEIAASVRRLKRGFEVDEDTLAVDVIAAAMEGVAQFPDPATHDAHAAGWRAAAHPAGGAAHLGELGAGGTREHGRARPGGGRADSAGAYCGTAAAGAGAGAGCDPEGGGEGVGEGLKIERQRARRTHRKSLKVKIERKD